MKDELAVRSNQLIDNEKLYELEEEKKRALEDKNAAMEALENASRQFLEEREEKKKLEVVLLDSLK
jgi:hypothetical protein